jgi:hypothetical protein
LLASAVHGFRRILISGAPVLAGKMIDILELRRYSLDIVNDRKFSKSYIGTSKSRNFEQFRRVFIGVLVVSKGKQQ